MRIIRKRALARPRVIVGIGVVGVVIAVTGGVALGTTQNGASTNVATSVEASASSSIGLLRRAQTPADAIPASTPVVFSEASGANTALARRVTGSEADESWVIPGTGSVCILAQVPSIQIGGAVCVPTSAAANGELDVQAASAKYPGTELVAGVEPDGISSVTLDLAGGGSGAVSVHENVYMSLVHGAVTKVVAHGASGSLTVEGMSASKRVTEHS